MELQGQVAIVTGAGSGQGRATARLFANEGAKVVVADINLEGARETAALVNAHHPDCAVAVRCDVSQAEDARAATETALSRFGRLDILINNAGLTLWKTIDDNTEAEFDRVVAVNLKGVFLCTKFAIPAMRRGGRGSIVNISSAAATTALRAHFAYCAAKAGVVQMTRALALDHGRENIRINCILPGAVMTPMLGLATDLSDPAKLKALAGSNALGRIAEPDEVDSVSLFLCSKAASFVTGAALTVDGGSGGGGVLRSRSETPH
jgi:NAD(P)-dependent dehydrogenase (short-subunit alcohol dehydrogenase family)